MVLLVPDFFEEDAQRPALPASGENQFTKRNQIPRLNKAQKAERTTRPVHALLGGLSLPLAFLTEGVYSIRSVNMLQMILSNIF
jgi:hypothetical protein